MANKITLITPPDFYENGNFSILFMGMTGDDQTVASYWLGQRENLPETNLYVYQDEPTIPWLLYAANRSAVTFINLDTGYPIIDRLASYILSKPGVYYTTKDQNIKELMSHINTKYVNSIEEFLERAYNEQE